MKKLIVGLTTLCLTAGSVIGVAQPSFARTILGQEASCTNLLANGTMEEEGSWRLESGPIAARFVGEARDGKRALLIGPSGDASKAGQRWSSARQTVALPAEGPLRLSFWYNYRPGNVENDRMQIALLDDAGGELSYLIDGNESSEGWQEFSVDISEFAGQPAQVFFAVESDGATGKAQLLIDNVQICGPEALVPAAVPEAAPEAAPETAPEAAPAAPAPTPAPAAPAPTPAPVSIDSSQAVPLGALGVSYSDLRGPFDGIRANFNLPAAWQFNQGTALELRYIVFINKPGPDGSQSALNVLLNGTSLGNIPLDKAGEQKVTLPVPPEALLLPAGLTTHQLQINLDSGLDCVTDQQVRVVIRPDSQLVLPHTLRAPQASLAALPWPIVQQSFQADEATLVVPPQPSTGELRAALTVASSLGQMSRGLLDLNVVAADKLTDEIQENSNLVFVGTPAAFPMLGEAKLPAPIAEGRYSAAGEQAGDGIVQMAPSPWNPSKVLLVVGGNDEAAVVKAGQVLGYGELRGAPQNLALVAKVNTDPATAPATMDRSFSDLGYAAQRISGRGQNSVSFRFDVPAGQSLGGDGTLNLVYNHSALLDYGRSNAQVTLNGQPLKSLRLSDQSTQPEALRITIPRSALLPGSNELMVSTLFAPINRCVVTDHNDLWMMIWPESNLNLPIDSRSSRSDGEADLSNIASAFSLSGDAGNTAFIVDRDDVASLETAAKLAFTLGSQTPGTSVGLNAAYDDDIADGIRKNRHLIVVGRPSTLALLGELNPALPAPFEEGSDIASQPGGRAVYRVGDDTSIGYLQLANAPWSGQPVLAVLGSNDEGLRWASDALIDPNQTTRLSGRLAVAQAGGQVYSSTAAPAQGSLEAPASPKVTDPAEVAALSAAPERRTWWLLPGILVSALLIAGIGGYLAYTTLRQRRAAQAR
jgi:cellulose synthase operon protein B